MTDSANTATVKASLYHDDTSIRFASNSKVKLRKGDINVKVTKLEKHVQIAEEKVQPTDVDEIFVGSAKVEDQSFMIRQLSF